MRYQPAYSYPGARHIPQKNTDTKKPWKFQPAQTKNSESNPALRMLRFLLMVVGSLVLIIGGAHYFTAERAQHWEKVTAEIVSAEVVRLKYDDSRPLFTAKVLYKYVVDGVEYTGSRLSVSPPRSHSPGVVKQMLAPYSSGRTVIAQVNSNKPEQVFLTTDPDYYLMYMVAPALLLIALSLAIGQAQYVHAERKRREKWKFGDWKVPDAAMA